MSVIITEVAIQADGTFAVELHNNGATAADLTGQFLGLYSGLTVFQLPIPASTTIPPGGTLTIGHSSIPGLDLTPDDSAFDQSFGSAGLTPPALELVTINPNNPFEPSDGFGEFFGTPFALDGVYEGSESRTASPTGVENPTETSGFTNNTLGTPCFLAGTLIATPGGERAVETLSAGDTVLTADGRSVPVLWVGRKQVRKQIGQMPEAVAPVCIAAGALGTHSDLYVTADHGMILDGCIVNAGVLVNGDTITRAPYNGPFTVYHIETERHEVLLANGARAESFIDYVDRAAFDNPDGALTRSGVDRIVPEMGLPRIASARLLPDRLRHSA